jgi:hypothetical protein
VTAYNGTFNSPFFDKETFLTFSNTSFSSPYQLGYVLFFSAFTSEIARFEQGHHLLPYKNAHYCFCPSTEQN